MAKQKSGVSVNITGDVSGQVVIGNHNTVIKNISQSPVTSASVEDLLHLLGKLKSQIQMEAPDNIKEKALEKANELEHAVLEKKPNLVTVEYVKHWFEKNLPNLVRVVAHIADELNKYTL